MKRDLDLLREIMLKIEESDENLDITCLTDVSSKYALISFHVQLLIDSDFIEATPISIMRQSFENYIITRLTSHGCDYLDSVRDEGVWSKTKSSLIQVGSSASLDIIKQLAGKIILNSLGL